MKTKTLLILLILISLFSCKNKELEKLRLENARLRNEMYQKSQTVYVWTILYCKAGDSFTWSGLNSRKRLENVKERMYWSEIKMIREFNEEIKYRLQNELENEVRDRLGSYLHSIIKKESFVFDNYVEASQFKDKVLIGENE